VLLSYFTIDGKAVTVLGAHVAAVKYMFAETGAAIIILREF